MSRNESNIKLSIIIPIFNVEKYLKSCLDSICNKANDSVELILINDGSSDNSHNICLEYSSECENIIYLSQKNLGVSSARNRGIMESKGEYITFIDADDEVKKEFVDSILKEINKNRESIDFFMWGIEYHWILGDKTEKISTISYDTNKYNTNDFLRNLSNYLDEYYFNFVWNKLYKREVILSNNITFNTKFKRSEDLLFNLDYISNCKGIKVLENILYIHKNINKQSITFRYDKNQFENEKIVYKKFQQILNETDDYKNTSEKIDDYFINISFSMITYIINRNYGLSFKEKKKQIFNIVSDEEFKNVIYKNRNTNMKVKIIWILIKIRSYILTLLVCKLIWLLY